jgi:hypothetical protein
MRTAWPMSRVHAAVAGRVGHRIDWRGYAPGFLDAYVDECASGGRGAGRLRRGVPAWHIRPTTDSPLVAVATESGIGYE